MLGVHCRPAEDGRHEDARTEALFHEARPMRSRNSLLVLVLAALAGCDRDVANPSRPVIEPETVAQLSPPTASCTGCFLLPTTFTRRARQTVGDDVRLPAGDPSASYLLVAQDDGGRETDVKITINGITVVGPGRLVGGGVLEVRVPAPLSGSPNKMTVLPLGATGAKVTIWILDGAAEIGPAGGTVTAPGSRATLTLAAGATPSALTVQLVDVAPLPPTHNSLSATGLRVIVDGAPGVAFAPAPLTIEVPLTALPPSGHIAALRASIPSLATDFLWKTAIVNTSTRRATVSGPANGFFAHLPMSASRAEIDIDAESYDAPTVASGPGFSASATSPQSATSGIICSLQSVGSLTPVYPTTVGSFAGASLWHDPNSAALLGATKVIVLLHGWDPSVATSCGDYLQKQPRADVYFAQLRTLLSAEALTAWPVLLVDYPVANSFAFSGSALSDALVWLQAQYNVDVVLVGHSMGGLVAREAASLMSRKPLGIITLGTPHLGSELANLGLNLGFWGIAVDTDGRNSLVSGLMGRQTPEAPLVAYGSKVTSAWSCTLGVLCTWVNDGLAPGFWSKKYTYSAGHLLCQVYGRCVSDGVVPSGSSLPSFVSSSDLREQVGIDHTTIKGGFGASMDRRLAADIRAFLASGGFCNRVVDFTGGQLPPSWTQFLVRGGPGLINDRLEGLPTDGGARIGSSVAPTAVNLLTIEYEATSNQSVFGTHHGINLVSGSSILNIYEQNASFNFGAGQLAFRIQDDFGLWPNGNGPIVAESILPYDPGQHRYRLEISSGQARWSATNVVTNRLVTATLSLPSTFNTNSLDGFYFYVYETTGNGTWADNLKITCQ
jgi:pimeloyl-ACP methyl ester carboxylesterase